MRKKIIALLLPFYLVFNASAQELIDSEFLLGINQATIQAIAGFEVENAVDLFKLKYSTLDLESKVDTASGLIGLPLVDQSEEIPILIYQHGTVADRNSVPSNLSEEFQLVTVFSSFGYLVVATDYLGLGESRGQHPYVHADSEATAAIDMVRAAITQAEDMGYLVSNEVYITGYSQGGHAAMAAHKYIQEQLADEFVVKASGPMSGPYDISGRQTEFSLSDKEFLFPAYLANVTLSYQRAYPDLFPNNELVEYFKPVYLEQVLRFANEEIDLFELNNFMINTLTELEGSSIPRRMFFDEVVDAIFNDPDHPASIALARNDLFDWTPLAPTRMYYCTGDEQVWFENALKAEEVMNQNGAPDVAAVNVGEGLSHGDCVIPATTTVLDFFNTIKNTVSSNENLAVDPGLIQVVPNPASNLINLNISPQLHENFTLHILDLQGRIITQYRNANKQSKLSVENFERGMYLLRFNFADGKNVIKKLVIK